MNMASFFRWAALAPIAIAAVLLLTGWPGLKVHQEHLRVVFSYTDPSRATAVIALIVLAGVSLVASIALEVHRMAETVRRLAERLET